MDGQNGHKIEVNRYLLEKDGEKALVLYWYQAHGHVTPSEYAAKYHLVADSIVMNRSDGALVRIITGLRKSEKPVGSGSPGCRSCSASDATSRSVRPAVAKRGTEKTYDRLMRATLRRSEGAYSPR